MEGKAQNIVDIIKDYENNQMTVKHVLDWVGQFAPEEQEFVLEELTVIFSKTYLTKSKCIELLKGYIDFLAKHYKYTTVAEFLGNAVFLDLQAENKSQKELLVLLNQVLIANYGVNISECGVTATHYIYLDDVLSTGNTIYRDISTWLLESNISERNKTNHEFILAKKLNLDICLLCMHTWGMSNVEYRLMINVHDSTKKYITYFRYYPVENNIKSHNPALNFMLPIENQPNEVKLYLNSLEYAIREEDRAFRKVIHPAKEELFSSPQSRIRLENLFLHKGIEILNNVQNLNVKQIRPLGYTIKSHKTLGLGTLFFTFRNIPNNCPIVFWWASNTWRPLFTLKNRGGN